MSHLEAKISYKRLVVKVDDILIKQHNSQYLPWHPPIPCCGDIKWLAYNSRSCTFAYNKIDEVWEAGYRYLGFYFKIIPAGPAYIINNDGHFLTKEERWTPLRSFRRIFKTYPQAEAFAPENSIIMPLTMQLLN